MTKFQVGDRVTCPEGWGPCSDRPEAKRGRVEECNSNSVVIALDSGSHVQWPVHLVHGEREIQVLDHGYVALTDVMGNDRTPAQTARTSYRNKAERTEEEDARLTDYLVRNRHTTPLEFCQVRFYMKMPIFVARQLVRHRTASINEVSYRYVKAAREFYVPALDRMQRQSKDNKQGSSSEIIDKPLDAASLIGLAGDIAFNTYEQLLSLGLSAELARTVLPLGTYTEWYWQTDLHNFLHMLRLRLDPHAQYEIRVYAQAMLDLVRPVFPTIISSWEKHK